MASPKPRPAALKIVEGRGNGRDSGGRRIATPPTFRRTTPLPPTWLDADALAEWHSVVAELERLGCVKELDAAALTAYCTTVALHAQATRQLRDEHTLDSPLVGIQQRAATSLRAWASEFGLTPLGRRGVDVGDAPTDAGPFG